MSKKPDDAARIAGLTSIFQTGNAPKAMKEPSPPPALPREPATVETPAPAPLAKKKKVGKSRDPNFHHFGVYLRKDSHKRANRRLEDMESGKDFSDLMQELLDQWLASE
jgi:hypothetical protein